MKLDPPAIAANGKTLDDDWLVTDATGLGLSLKNQRTAATLALGYDSIYSFFLDAARSTAAKPFGILQLHSQITEAIDGTTTVKPLPPPRRGADTFPTDRFRPLVLQNAGNAYFEDRCDLDRLDEVDWTAVRATNWAGALQEGKQAEFLVEHSFPWDLVSRIGVRTMATRLRVEQALRDAAYRPVIEVLPAWYYGGSRP